MNNQHAALARSAASLPKLYSLKIMSIDCNRTRNEHFVNHSLDDDSSSKATTSDVKTTSKITTNDEKTVM